MHHIKDIMFIQDLFKLTKPILKDIAADLNIDTTLNKNELVLRIYDNRNRFSEDTVIKLENRILATKATAVTWYNLDGGVTVHDFRRLINDNSNFNPFESMNEIQENDVTTTPELLIGSAALNESGTFLRYIYKSGVRYETTPTTIRPITRSAISTVYYDADRGILEIRGDTRKAPDIARKVAQTLGLQITMEPVEAPFNQEMGDIADRLKGQLTEATSKPELIFEKFSEGELNSVVNVLRALDEYMQTKDIDVLETHLQNASDSFMQGEAIVPFAALVMSGMETLGMAGSSEIRMLPLFSYLNPHLQHQGGFIKFPFNIENVEETFTIRIGINTQSVVFVSQVTEDVIDFVRDRVII
ncbi:SAP domain-containing protein [Peribacillus simplex]|uniref:SAP domain-containing protein n=1 Tax=Peribacillus simplex TaxID=1478 RepID=UPI0033350E8E